MASAGLSQQEVAAIFSIGDTNGDGEIDVEEFIAVMCPSAMAVVFKISQAVKGKEGAAAANDPNDVTICQRLLCTDGENTELGESSDIFREKDIDQLMEEQRRISGN